jgi:hypothetical protein
MTDELPEGAAKPGGQRCRKPAQAVARGGGSWADAAQQERADLPRLVLLEKCEAVFR